MHISVPSRCPLNSWQGLEEFLGSWSIPPRSSPLDGLWIALRNMSHSAHTDIEKDASVKQDSPQHIDRKLGRVTTRSIQVKCSPAHFFWHVFTHLSRRVMIIIISPSPDSLFTIESLLTLLRCKNTNVCFGARCAD
jgi:hypothetical protein